MGIVTHRDEPAAEEASPVKLRIEIESDSAAKARKKRIVALHRVAGIWANRMDIPADGLQYERELRDEWR